MMKKVFVFALLVSLTGLLTPQAQAGNKRIMSVQAAKVLAEDRKSVV